MKNPSATEQSRIPISKVERASRFIATGMKVGGNYLRHYAKSLVKADKKGKEDLDETNAEEIYQFLSHLKGSALKAAQMLSMDQGLLPAAYAKRFQRAQYSAPPLSYPLVVRTFRRHFRCDPLDIFDTFEQQAVNAASIGQVHRATYQGKKLAVKVQYPGVAESVQSDLRMAKPLAAKMMQVSLKDMEYYLQEIEEKLLEETDYEHELSQSVIISQACEHIGNLTFPQYYPEMSCRHILTMDWIEGVHLADWFKGNPSREERNRIAQSIWDFYHFLFHSLKKIHADPHPGNFLITPEMKLAVIDFGCVKSIPDDFYNDYFSFLLNGFTEDESEFIGRLKNLNFILSTDGPREISMFKDIFCRLIALLGEPFRHERFDFDNREYFDEILHTVDRLSHDKKIKKANAARGSKHGIYVNRTYFGLYSLMHKLRAQIITHGHTLTSRTLQKGTNRKN